MSLVPNHIHLSCFFFFALVLNLTFLASFGGNNYALADPFKGPDERYPAPPVSPWNLWARMFGIGVKSDYPSDNEIRKNFLGTGPDQTLAMVITLSELSRYREYCTTPALGLKCVFNAWPPRYLTRRGPEGKLRSERWFKDWYYRYNDIYMKEAVGTAYILVSSIDYPRTCDYFIHVGWALLWNDNVDRIILVAARDWNQQLVWYDKRDDDVQLRRNDANPDGGNGNNPENGNNPGPGNNALGAATLVLPGGAIGATSDAVGAANAVKSTIPPASQIISGDGQDKDQGVSPLEFPLKTDILDLPMASLPPSDDTAAGTTKELRISSKDETLPSEPQLDDTSSTSTTDYLTADNENPDFKGLFQRRWRTLLPRDGQSCLDWLTESDFPDGPIQPSAPVAKTSSDPITAPTVETDGNLENYVEKLNIGVKEEVATLLVTQYDRSSSNPDFALDIKVSDSLGNMLHYEQHVDAPSGKEIKVSLSDPKGSFLWPLWPLYLTTGNNKEDPLQIEYGDVFLIGPQTDWGKTFVSSDPRQKCTVSAWTDSKREIECSIIVARHSS